jgi:hypothetical protein
VLGPETKPVNQRDVDDVLIGLQGKVLVDDTERLLAATAASEDFSRAMDSVQSATGMGTDQLKRLEAQILRISSSS